MSDVHEWLAWLSQQPDGTGECDGCHTYDSLWSLPSYLDAEPEACWQYCPKCFRRIVQRKGGAA